MVFIKMGKMILEPEYLDRIYAEWRIQDRRAISGDFSPTIWDLKKNYQREHRGGFIQQRFEDWLYSQGFTVIQDHGKRYLVFNGVEKRLTWFLLKHGVK
jgi:hypothetical protein